MELVVQYSSSGIRLGKEARQVYGEAFVTPLKAQKRSLKKLSISRNVAPH